MESLPHRLMTTELRQTTGWGGRLRKRFCNMFSESSTGNWAELQLPCFPSKQGELPDIWYNTFYTTCRPRLYLERNNLEHRLLESLTLTLTRRTPSLQTASPPHNQAFHLCRLQPQHNGHLGPGGLPLEGYLP